jgi:Domain of unknown function (DUF4111)
MSTTEQPPPEVVAYGSVLAEIVSVSSGQRLVGAYLHGSAAMGGWQPARSDVDLVFVLQDRTPSAALTGVEQALLHDAPACPGTGLECSVVTAQQASNPTPPWPFLLHVQSAPGQEARRVRGDAVEGDRDLLMHYAVCRAAGVPLFGPEPTTVFGAVPRVPILSYLADELGWGLAHGSAAYAILNACRALVYAADGDLVSKLSGGRQALEKGLGPAEVIARALDEQQGKLPPEAITDRAASFVRLVADSLQHDQGSSGSAT